MRPTREMANRTAPRAQPQPGSRPESTSFEDSKTDARSRIASGTTAAAALPWLDGDSLAALATYVESMSRKTPFLTLPVIPLGSSSTS